MTKTEMMVHQLDEQARHNKQVEHNQKVGNVIAGVTGVLGAISRPASAAIGLAGKKGSVVKNVVKKIVNAEGDESNVTETTTETRR